MQLRIRRAALCAGLVLSAVALALPVSSLVGSGGSGDEPPRPPEQDLAAPVGGTEEAVTPDGFDFAEAAPRSAHLSALPATPPSTLSTLASLSSTPVPPRTSISQGRFTPAAATESDPGAFDSFGERANQASGPASDEPSDASFGPSEVVAVDALLDDPWARVRWCESSDRYDIATGNGFYGAYQFTLATWDWVAEVIGRDDLIGIRPNLAAATDQDRMAQALGFEIPGGGLQHWPVCGKHYGRP